jgi:hypothetical protein
VLLSHGKDNLAAREFLKFLRAEVTQALLLDSGYGVE